MIPPAASLTAAAAAVLGALALRTILSLSQRKRLLREGEKQITAPGSAALLDGPALPDSILTVVQPVLSGDPLLESRLAANLAFLPGQAFLWLTDEEDAEAIRITTRLQRNHPHQSITLLPCPPCPDATNPKLWKLRMAAPRVTTAFFGVLDDDTVLPGRSAAVLVRAASAADLATALPFYEPAPDLPSRLLGQFVNNNSIFTYLGTTRLIPPCTVNGMAWVIRTERLTWLENFTPVMHHLTDDLALAELVLRRGGTIRQTAAPVFLRSTVSGLGHYWRFMHRWYVFAVLLMRRQPAGRQALIFLLHGLPPLLLVWLALATLTALGAGGPASLLMPAAVLLVRHGTLAVLQGRFAGRSCLGGAPLSLLSEFLQPLHLAHALACRTIRWRTRRYHVRATDDFHSV